MNAYNDMLDGDEVHNDDITVIGPAIDAVNFIRVNHQAVADRNLGYLRERIARRIAHEKAEAEKAALTLVV